MFRWLVFCCLVLLILETGCAGKMLLASKDDKETLVLYSELDNKFTEDLVATFNKSSESKVDIKAIYEISDKLPKPDLVLAEKRTLNGLKIDHRLKPLALSVTDVFPTDFYDEDLLWYGIFYDPTVFLVNQHYARQVGQNNLQSWKDIENSTNCRIAIENLSDSNSTQNFLAAFADKCGETTSLNYFANINTLVTNYAKFPFTPVRMAAVGDVDLAITRQSYVFKYLDNKFPAYVVMPKEGTPVNLYGVGVFIDCQHDDLATEFIQWLLFKEEVQKVSLVNNTGFLFLLPNGLQCSVADANKLWQNKTYLMASAQEKLTNKWLEKVRFNNRLYREGK